jgi:hypothetical protein
MSFDICEVITQLVHLTAAQMLFLISITALLLVGLSLFVLFHSLKK